MDLRPLIPVTPDWPKPGVNFLDIGGILRDPQAFRYCADRLADMIHACEITSVVAIESRGFMFAGAACAAAACPLWLARKAGRLPGRCYQYTYTTEYSRDCLEIQSLANLGARPLIVDDLLATGGTITAVAGLLRENFPIDQLSAAVIINLDFLPGKQRLITDGINLLSLVDYHA